MPTKPYIIALEEHLLRPGDKAAHHRSGHNQCAPDRGAPRRCRRVAVRGNGRGRHRYAGLVARQIRDCRNWMPRLLLGWRAAPMTGSMKPSVRIPTGSPPLPQFHARSEGRGRRVGTHCHPAGVQGRAWSTADQRAVSRRQAVLADLRAGAGARCAALHAPLDTAPGGHRSLLQGLRRAVSVAAPGGPGASPSKPQTQGIRLVLSGVFDAYPGLKIILGHLGEGLPFYLWRISMGWRATPRR